MKALTVALVCIVGLMITSSDADAQRRRGGWNSSGWVKLGERTVEGRTDRDTIAVGRHEGKFSKLTMVVEDNDLELLEFTVTFTNGQTFRPRVGHYFRENSKTRVIDLPGDDRSIRKIDLRYRNLSRGQRAQIEIWGFKTEDAGRRRGR